jgi:hypothetical protein
MLTHEKISLAIALLFVGLLSTGSVVSADDRDRRSEQRMSSRDQRSFENYLDSNWRVAQQLYQNPELIRDRQFVREEESLDEWLDSHPDAADALEANPHKYIWSERGRQKSTGQQPTERRAGYMSEQDLRSFETFLDSHPETAQRLYENPDLISDRQFTRSNRALNNWLDDHPEAADTIQANPHKFLWRERSVGVGDFLQQLLR